MFKLTFSFDQLVVHMHESLEVFDRLDLELGRGVLVTNKDGARVLLECADCPHVVDALLDGHVQRQSLVDAGDDDEDLASVHDGTDAHRERVCGHFVDIVAKESGVGDDGLLSERLEAGSRDQTRSGLVEGDVSVRADSFRKRQT